MKIIDEILPKVKAGVRLDKDNKTLWIKTDTLDGYGRIIVEDGSIWCRVFYEDYEDNPTSSKMEQVDKDINVRSKDEPQNCDTCRHYFGKDFDIECEVKAFGNECRYEPKDEPKICDTCRYYNSNIPCGSTPSACKEADKFAEKFVDGLKKLKPKTEPQKWEKPPKFEHKGIQTACVTVPMSLIEDEPQTNADQHVQHVGSVESVEPTWTKEEHEAFYTFLWNVINPNEMQDYIEMFETKDEPQTCSVSGRPYSECADCEHFRCTADEPQTERSNDAE